MDFSFKYNNRQYTAADFIKEGEEYILNLERGITVTARQKLYSDFDAHEWVLWFENCTAADSFIFSDINDCDFNIKLKNPLCAKVGHIPKKGFPSVTSMSGPVAPNYYKESDEVSSSEFRLFTEYIFEDGKRSYHNNDARSSDETMPVFDVSSDDAGVIVGIGWTGGWRADFVRDGENVRIVTGLKNACFYLRAGEKLRTSSTVIMEYDENDKYNKYNKFRRFIKKYFSHKTKFPHKADGLLAVSLWGALPSDNMIERINQYKDHDIQFDQIWIDAMWTVHSGESADHQNGWGKYNGNWTVNTQIHPNKLADVRDAAQKAGSRLMLWCEPEYVVSDDAPVLSEHPEWFLGKKLLYYGNDDALKYATDLICEMIDYLNLGCYRQDFCLGPAKYFEDNDEKDRSGVTEIKHIMGMYHMWDTILEKYPYIIIDNCASGGRRIDMETLKRSIPFFRSDYQCIYNEKSEVLQIHNTGISHYLPYNGCTTREIGDIYAARSSYSSSWGAAGYGAIFQNIEEADFECLKRIVEEYRSIRKYFSCDFYNHGSLCYDDTAWTIWQYHNPENQTGIVMAFRRCASPHDCAEITLDGMTSGQYTYTDLNTASAFVGDKRLKITLPQKRSSVIYEYRLYGGKIYV